MMIGYRIFETYPVLFSECRTEAWWYVEGVGWQPLELWDLWHDTHEHIGADGPTVFAHACKMGLEGIVSKRKASIYRSGRSPDWLKSKNPGCEAVRRDRGRLVLDLLDTKLLGPPGQEFVELRLGGPDNLVLQHLYQPVDRGIAVYGLEHPVIGRSM